MRGTIVSHRENGWQSIPNAQHLRTCKMCHLHKGRGFMRSFVVWSLRAVLCCSLAAANMYVCMKGRSKPARTGTPGVSAQLSGTPISACACDKLCSCSTQKFRTFYCQFFRGPVTATHLPKGFMTTNKLIHAGRAYLCRGKFVSGLTSVGPVERTEPPARPRTRPGTWPGGSMPACARP